jgi:hypothetical protein
MRKGNALVVSLEAHWRRWWLPTSFRLSRVRYEWLSKVIPMLHLALWEYVAHRGDVETRHYRLDGASAAAHLARLSR